MLLCKCWKGDVRSVSYFPGTYIYTFLNEISEVRYLLRHVFIEIQNCASNNFFVLNSHLCSSITKKNKETFPYNASSTKHPNITTTSRESDNEIFLKVNSILSGTRISEINPTIRNNTWNTLPSGKNNATQSDIHRGA